jgi:hypothetical protein
VVLHLFGEVGGDLVHNPVAVNTVGRYHNEAVDLPFEILPRSYVESELGLACALLPEDAIGSFASDLLEPLALMGKGGVL